MTTWIIVEDEQDINDLLFAMFQIWGIDGECFSSYDEVVAWIDDIDNSSKEIELPTLALVDIRLSRGSEDPSGLEVSARLRRSDKLNNMTIILITAYNLSPAQEQQYMLRSQADDLIYKPLPLPDDMRSRIFQVINNRAAKIGRSL